MNDACFEFCYTVRFGFFFFFFNFTELWVLIMIIFLYVYIGHTHLLNFFSLKLQIISLNIITSLFFNPCE